LEEIILSMFAAIGITYFILQIADYFIYRNRHLSFPLLIDIRNQSEEEILSTFEMIAYVRQKASGRAVIPEIVLLDTNQKEDRILWLNAQLNGFGLKGEICNPENESIEQYFSAI